MHLHDPWGSCLKQLQCCKAPSTLQVTAWSPFNSGSFPSCSIMSETALVMSPCFFQQPGKGLFRRGSNSTSRDALDSLHKPHHLPFSWCAYVHAWCYLCMNHSHGSVFVDWVFGACLHTTFVTPRDPRLSQYWQMLLCWLTSSTYRGSAF